MRSSLIRNKPYYLNFVGVVCSESVFVVRLRMLPASGFEFCIMSPLCQSGSGKMELSLLPERKLEIVEPPVPTFDELKKIEKEASLEYYVHAQFGTCNPPASFAGGLLTFNVEHGWLEGLIHGWRAGFLSNKDYTQLTACESMEDAVLVLSETEYSASLAAERGKLSNKTRILNRIQQKHVDDMLFGAPLLVFT